MAAEIYPPLDQVAQLLVATLMDAAIEGTLVLLAAWRVLPQWATLQRHHPVASQLGIQPISLAPSPELELPGPSPMDQPEAVSAPAIVDMDQWHTVVESDSLTSSWRSFHTASPVVVGLIIWLAACAIAMTRPSHLEGRLLAILDPKRNRAAVTWSGIAVLVLFLMVLVVPVAMLNASESNPPQSAKPTTTTRPAQRNGATRPVATAPASSPVDDLAAASVREVRQAARWVDQAKSFRIKLEVKWNPPAGADEGAAEATEQSGTS